MGPIPGLQAALACCLARAGRREEAHALLKMLRDKSTHEYVAPAFLVILNAMLGENDAAFEWLAKAYEERSLLIALLQVEPSLDPLRADPRFKDYVSRVFP